jgi:hypothetical protein
LDVGSIVFHSNHRSSTCGSLVIISNISSITLMQNPQTLVQVF